MCGAVGAIDAAVRSRDTRYSLPLSSKWVLWICFTIKFEKGHELVTSGMPMARVADRDPMPLDRPHVKHGYYTCPVNTLPYVLCRYAFDLQAEVHHQ